MIILEEEYNIKEKQYFTFVLTRHFAIILSLISIIKYLQKFHIVRSVRKYNHQNVLQDWRGIAIKTRERSKRNSEDFSQAEQSGDNNV